ncbi:23S rRNA pseudouridine(955/2504/2580) synthase RluC [Dasania sp. GY-MA-18]|uniref:Pseudouridine synthase n=1 Tax=Dasania phycosphaerae TaxID=2950436 RepID=A0A9J6RIX6_9GAMM|nr:MULTISPECIES: 23S rRNA pseudouridine(955/2504/2580) synthase RluC [Dasania]MCR8921952.1 23S rRNA pseudouridine(955/2504/2580) synthase RluC [Dasania sp. GY-MA-18]MCZ0864380.1 23S rRNA pseudouridine(955/2504/2580) synthase RluC [Dasania phycosphaerae]MCZ0868108.1 23S rRNA pseudouridine(955/2504/2580) synthase RluC [Dasania phycosphaerae]
MNDRPVENKPKVRFVTITDAHEGQRIDNFLLRELKGVPKSRIYRILRKGEVRVNKARVKPEYKLADGDLVRVPPVTVADRTAPTSVSDGLTAVLENAILYEDAALLVVNKPSGLAVHGGSGISLGLIEALRVIRPQAKFLELVHRLDRDTSGCIMVAKKRSMLKYLQNCLRERQGIVKRYRALVSGQWPKRCKLVVAPLLKISLQSGERMVNVSPEGKKSTTQFDVIKRYTDATLVEARPITGRTHQIRVHALHAGCPLLGDEKYGQPEANRLFKQKGLKRLFLHAASLTFCLPDSEQSITVEAPLEPSLDRLLQGLEVQA